MNCTSVYFLIVILCCCFAKYYHWGKLGKEFFLRYFLQLQVNLQFSKNKKVFLKKFLDI